MSSVARKAALLSRFSDAYSQARLDAQCLLRRCIDRAETVQRIIYIATVVNATSAVLEAVGDHKVNGATLKGWCILKSLWREDCRLPISFVSPFFSSHSSIIYIWELFGFS
jgi:hypothetical protein